MVVGCGEVGVGNWHHLAVTCDGLRVRSFLDGENVGEVILDSKGSAFDIMTDFSVGHDPWDATRTADASFDEIRVYPFPLTSEEIARVVSTPPERF